MCAERSVSRGTNGSSLSRKSSRQLQARIFLLDDSVHTFSINSCALGSELFAAIIEKQTILECDYFDLEYVNGEGVRCWIDHSRSVVRQVGPGKDLVFIFAVKFYTPHPNLLEEEYTRYLFALQIKRDIVSGQLICSTNTAALLASYIVQAEIGDFLDEDYLDNSYLRPLKIANQPGEEVLNKIVDFHRTHIGMSPSEADFHLLDTARKIEYYGVKMHLAKDHENLPLNLSVTHMGVVVFQNLTKINTFSWAKIRKLSFKRKKFLIKLHPEGYGYYKGMVEFYFETRDDCKRFWKKCIEHHSFFRCPASDKSQRKKPRVVTKGSSFRYCGRTQKELIEYVRENYSSKRDHFERPTKAKIAAKSPHNNKQSRLGKSYHPITAQKSSHSAPSRAVSDSSELNKVGNGTHTPLQQQRSASGAVRPRWSRSAGESPRVDAENPVPLLDVSTVETIEEPLPVTVVPVGPQKRGRKGRRFIEVSSSADEDDDRRVTASEMSLSSGGQQCWEDPPETSGETNDEPLPAREALKGSERLCRQRASIGGLGDLSDLSDSHKDLKHNPEHITESQPQRVVCIDQYRSARRPLAAAKRYKSTPNDVAGNSRLHAVDKFDSKELNADIPYVLLRRHKSPDQPRGSIKSAGQSRRSLVSKSMKSVKDEFDGGHEQNPPLPRAAPAHQTAQASQMRHSKSLDRRLASLAPKSPRLLREEYMQSQRRLVSDRDTIEALKSQLRAASSVRHMDNHHSHSRMLAASERPMFVSAYRLPPVNNFSAKDDTVGSSERNGGLDSRLYGAPRRQQSRQNKENQRARKAVSSDSEDDSQLRETVDLEGLLGVLPGNPIYLDSSSSSDDGEFDISPDRCSRPRSVSENEFKLRTPRSSRRSSICRGGGGHNSSLSLTDSSFNSDASFQSDDGEDNAFSGSPYSFLADCGQNQQMAAGKDDGGPSPDVVPATGAQSRPQPQTDLQSLQAPLLPEDSPEASSSSRPQEQTDLHSLQAPILTEDSPEASSSSRTQQQNDLPSLQTPLLLEDSPEASSSSRSQQETDLHSLLAPMLLEDSPDEEEDVIERNPCSEPCTEPCTSTHDSMSIDRDESPSVTNECKMVCSHSSSNTSCSDQIVIVTAAINDPDSTMIINDNEEDDNNKEGQKHTSISQVLESMLLKRLTGVSFLRTSTPTKEYVGSTGHIFHPQEHLEQPQQLKSAISAPGLSRDRVSPFSPLPAHLRRPFTSSSSSSSSSESMSPPERNPFSNVSLSSNPFMNIKPDLIAVDNQYDDNFDHCSKNPDSGSALVFLNESALSSISVGKSPTESRSADRFQDSVEGNLLSPESSRAHSLPDDGNDGDEEPDDFVLPSDHRSLSRQSSSSSSASSPSSTPTSESGEYPAAEEGPPMSAERIDEEEQSDTSTSTSEGSEEIEPFPPPPPQSDMLIFDERDEDIFQQMQQQREDICVTAGGSGAEPMTADLPQPDLTSPSSDFPHPPPPPLLTDSYPPCREDASSSDVPSLFADDSAATSVIQVEEDTTLEGRCSAPGDVEATADAVVAAGDADVDELSDRVASVDGECEHTRVANHDDEDIVALLEEEEAKEESLSRIIEEAEANGADIGDVPDIPDSKVPPSAEDSSNRYSAETVEVASEDAIEETEAVAKENNKAVTEEDDESVAKRADEAVTKEGDEKVDMEADEDVAMESDEDVPKEDDGVVTKQGNEEVTKEGGEEVANEDDEKVAKEADEYVAKEDDATDVKEDDEVVAKCSVSVVVTKEDDEEVAKEADENAAKEDDATDVKEDDEVVAKCSVSVVVTKEDDPVVAKEADEDVAKEVDEAVAKRDDEAVAKEDDEEFAKEDDENAAKEDDATDVKEDDEVVAKCSVSVVVTKEDDPVVAKEADEDVAKEDDEEVAKEDDEEVAKEDDEVVAKEDNEDVAEESEDINSIGCAAEEIVNEILGGLDAGDASSSTEVPEKAEQSHSIGDEERVTSDDELRDGEVLGGTHSSAVTSDDGIGGQDRADEDKADEQGGAEERDADIGGVEWDEDVPDRGNATKEEVGDNVRSRVGFPERVDDDVKAEEVEVEVEEEIVPRHCSLLYDGEGEGEGAGAKESNSQEVEECQQVDIAEEVIVPMHCALLYNEEDDGEVEEVIVPAHCTLLYQAEGELLLYDEENNECTPTALQGGAVAPRPCPTVFDTDNNECDGKPGGDGEEDPLDNNDPSPCPAGLGHLQCRSPGGDEDGEC